MWFYPFLIVECIHVFIVFRSNSTDYMTSKQFIGMLFLASIFAFTEECLFRFYLPYMFDTFQNPYVNSLAFSLIHISNLSFGSKMEIMRQVVMTFCLGMWLNEQSNIFTQIHYHVIFNAIGIFGTYMYSRVCK